MHTSLIGAVVAVAWVGVALAGGVPGVSPVGAAAAAGAAVATAALLPPVPVSLLPIVAQAVLAATAALAVIASGGSAVPATLAMSVVVVGSVAGAWRRGDGGTLGLAAVASLGLAAVAVGLATDLAADPTARPFEGERGALLAVAGSALTLGAVTEAARRRRALGLLVAPVLAVGVLAAAVVPGEGAVGLAVVAVLAAASARPPLALGFLALAAASVPGAAPAAGLFAAASVLASVIGGVGVALLGLPGAVVVGALAASAPGGLPVLALSGATAAAAGVLAARRSTAARPPSPLTVGQVPAVALAAWLVVAPGSWAWVGDPRLGTYDAGAALAAAAAALVVVAAWTIGRLPVWVPAIFTTPPAPVVPLQVARAAAPIRLGALFAVGGLAAALFWSLAAAIR